MVASMHRVVSLIFDLGNLLDWLLSPTPDASVNLSQPTAAGMHNHDLSPLEIVIIISLKPPNSLAPLIAPYPTTTTSFLSQVATNHASPSIRLRRRKRLSQI